MTLPTRRALSDLLSRFACGSAAHRRGTTLIGLICSVLGAASSLPAQLLSNPEVIAAAQGSGQLAVFDRPDRNTLSGDILLMTVTGSVTNRITAAELRARGVSRVSAMTHDAGDTLYVLDASQKIVSRWMPSGAFHSAMALPLPSPTIRLRGLAVGSSGRLYVTDATDGVVYTCTSSAGCAATPLVGARPAGPQDRAGGMAISRDLSTLYVAMPSAARVARLTITPGGLVAAGVIASCVSGADCDRPRTDTIGITNRWCTDDTRCVAPLATDTTARVMTLPLHVGVQSDGSVIIADIAARGALHRFSSLGVRRGFVARRGIAIGETGNFAFAIEGDDGIAVAEFTLQRVSRFAAGGSLRGVFGGTVELSSAEGRADNARVQIADLLPRQISIAAVATGNFVGPISLRPPTCLFERDNIPFRACSSYGLSATLGAPFINVPPGAAGAGLLTVTATRPTLSGRYLVAVGGQPPFESSLLQVALNVNLPPKAILSPATQRVVLFPGDPPAQVPLSLQTFAANGEARFTGAWTPPPPAGQLTFSFTPPRADVRGTTTTALTTTITAKPSARSGVRLLRVTGSVAGTVPLASDDATIEVQVDCACTTTGQFVEPEVVPVVGGGLSGLSPSGRWRVVTTPGALPSTAPTVRIEAASNGTVLVGPFSNPRSWGFSPDPAERYVMITTPGPPGFGANDVNVEVFDLVNAGQRVFTHTIPGCVAGDAACVPPPRLCYSTGTTSCLGKGGTTSGPKFGLAQWGFSPDGRMFMIASINVRVSNTPLNVIVHDLTRGVGSAAVVSTEVSQLVSGFWQFSPCGDQLMLFAQRSLNGSTSDEAQFFLLGPGTSAAPFERATLVLPVTSGVGATVVPATVSFGDFDVVLTGLARVGGAPVGSFPCPQCRRRP